MRIIRQRLTDPKTNNHRNVSGGELCDLTPVAGLIVHLFRSSAYSGNRDGNNGFRPTTIVKNNVVVWSFEGLFRGMGKTAEILTYGDKDQPADDEYLIVIRDKSTVYEVVRVLDFANATVAVFDNKTIMVGGSSKEQLFDLKVEAAEELKLRYW